MDAIKSTPILKYNENHLANVRKAVGYEDVNRLKQDIEQFEDWIQKQNHFRVKEFDREYLERLLIYSKGSIERAKKKLDKLCTCTNLMPEYLQHFDIKNEFDHLFKVAHTCMLPRPTADNYRVIFIVATGEDDKEYQLIQFYRYIIVLSHYLVTNDYCQGFEIVSDLSNLPLNIIVRFNPLVIHRAFMVLTECLGQRTKKIHLFGCFKFFEIVLNIVKRGLSAKLQERIVIHADAESLYHYIPREQLPKDFGGDEMSVKELAERNFQELSSEEHIARVKFMEQVTTDESRRLTCQFNEEYSGMPGSFKSLCVD
ncbi:alpha-tocopherol transfer protein-like [Anticarsia gemmatalis]|uniref:alpha-tocopherol transfer protein-like n=1 Tax=Anticarsia gemmatalis TaxID=129554 RepID=UPI003F75E730